MPPHKYRSFVMTSVIVVSLLLVPALYASTPDGALRQPSARGVELGISGYVTERESPTVTTIRVLTSSTAREAIVTVE